MYFYLDDDCLDELNRRSIDCSKIFLYRPKILGHHSIFDRKVLNEYCIKMFSFLDAGRVAMVISRVFSWVEFTKRTLFSYQEVIKLDSELNNIYNLIRSYVNSYNPKINEEGSINSIGHVNLTRYKFSSNYKIVKEHYGLEDSDTYITYFYKFFIYAKSCFSDVLEIVQAIYGYVSESENYKEEDVSYIKSEVDEIEVFLGIITELMEFIKGIIEDEPSDLNVQKDKMRAMETDNPVIQSVIDRVLSNRDPE